jgi:hypothetical protein
MDITQMGMEVTELSASVHIEYTDTSIPSVIVRRRSEEAIELAATAS